MQLSHGYKFKYNLKGQNKKWLLVPGRQIVLDFLLSFSAVHKTPVKTCALGGGQ